MQRKLEPAEMLKRVPSSFESAARVAVAIVRRRKIFLKRPLTHAESRLVLAAMLFDLIGKKFGGGLASFLRATYYLPQILPVVVAAIDRKSTRLNSSHANI